MKTDTILGLLVILSFVNLIFSRVKHNNELKKEAKKTLLIELISLLVIEFIFIIIMILEFWVEICNDQKLVLLIINSLKILFITEKWIEYIFIFIFSAMQIINFIKLFENKKDLIWKFLETRNNLRKENIKCLE